MRIAAIMLLLFLARTSSPLLTTFPLRNIPTRLLSTLPLLTIVSGPTAIGKTATAASLTPQPTFIISCDSVQIYEHLTIGANVPSPSTLEKYPPHHLLGTTPLQPIHPTRDATATAASWLDKTIELLTPPPNGPTPEHPVICGGSMMYIDWLLNGLPTSPAWSNDTLSNLPSTPANLNSTIQEAIDSSVAAAAYAPLTSTPATWSSLHSSILNTLSPSLHLSPSQLASLHVRLANLSRNDFYRLRRVLEVAITTAATASTAPIFTSRRHTPPLPCTDIRVFFLCPQSRLSHCHTIDSRCDDMLQAGLLEEVAALIVDHDLQNTTVAKAIGYRQTIKYLMREEPVEGDVTSYEAFVEEFKAASRRYAKQQMQWFRKEPRAMFVEVGEGGVEGVAATVQRIDSLRALGRSEFERLLEDPAGENARVRAANVGQGKGMRTFMSEPVAGKVVEELVRRGDKCTRRVRRHLDGE